MEAGRNRVCGHLTSINIARFENVVNLVHHSLRRRRRGWPRSRCWSWLRVFLAAREHHATDKQGSEQKRYFFHFVNVMIVNVYSTFSLRLKLSISESSATKAKKRSLETAW